MQKNLHLFHIPVMGTGHSIDTPIRVAHFGISSVISIVDDILIDKINRYYCEKFNLQYIEVKRKEEDGRAKRITAYLNTVNRIVNDKLDTLKHLPFFEDNDKAKYFRMLPESSALKAAYNRLLSLKGTGEAEELSLKLNSMIEAGSIDVNIMSKVDKLNYNKGGESLSDEFSDAKAALRGYAMSELNSAVVFSAGFNRGLYSYLSQFKCFYRDAAGKISKRIIVKVSDFRSALIQGKFLAMKGLEVSEYRIESGLNCGGHAFASQGMLLPALLREFREKREELTKQIKPMIVAYYEKNGMRYPAEALNEQPAITVQGGIGTSGETDRMLKDFGCDAAGWGSPFLLVPEATCVDNPTLELLKNARKEDLYLSNASPLGVPFNNLRGTGSELWTKERAETGTPGSACPKKFLVSNKEFTDLPICTASKEFQVQKIESINRENIPAEEKEKQISAVQEKVCLCVHLGNGALISLGIQKGGKHPQAICPGPNIVWFNREYSLEEMVDHIYGRGNQLTAAERPHMFCQEIELYVTYYLKLRSEAGDDKQKNEYADKFIENLEAGMDYCLEISQEQPYPNENLNSVSEFVFEQRRRIESMRRAV